MAQMLDFEKPILELEDRIAGLRKFAEENGVGLETELRTLEAKLRQLQTDTFAALSPWDRVRLARHSERPTASDYIQAVFQDFTELKGDRAFGDDPAIIGGIAFLNGLPVTVIGHQKGRDTKENIRRNFGMAHPEGYRKALRLMRQAEKFRRPVVTFIDTSGAYCGLGAEERGQGQAIAQNLMEMARLRVPVLSVVIGEGGSGGALGIGVADRVAMLSTAVYSVISPEGLASILWKDAARASEAASVMKLTATDLKALGVVDTVLEEPLGGAHRHPAETAALVGAWLSDELEALRHQSPEQLIETRYTKFRAMGALG